MAERKEVNLNLGQVAITPSMQAVGGTNQAVAPGVLKDNSALRLSRSLAQFSNLLGQASNINMQRGQDEAQSLTAQEIDDIITGKITAPDGGPLGKLGFQKAFQQTATKRWYDTTGVQKYAELENKIDIKLDELIKSEATIDTAQQYVEGEINALQSEINDHFEGKPFGQKVSNLLSGELSSRVLAGALKGYEKKQIAYVNAIKEEELRNLFGDVGAAESDMSFKAVLDFTEKSLSERNYSNPEKQKFLLNTFSDTLNSIIATNPERAEDFIKQAKSRKQFKTLDARVMIAKFDKILDNISDVDDERDLVKEAQKLQGFSSQLIKEIRSAQVAKKQNLSKDPSIFNAARNVFNNLGLDIPQFEKDALITKILDSDNPLNEFTRRLNLISMGSGTDPFTRDLIGRSLSSLNRSIIEVLQSPDDRSIGITREQRNLIEDQAFDYFNNLGTENKNVTPELFMLQQAIPGKPPQRLLQIYADASKFDAFIDQDDIRRKLIGKFNIAVGSDDNIKQYYTDDKIKEDSAFLAKELNSLLKSEGLKIAGRDVKITTEDQISNIQKQFKEVTDEYINERSEKITRAIQSLRILEDNLEQSLRMPIDASERLNVREFKKSELEPDKDSGLFFKAGGFLPGGLGDETPELRDFESLYNSTVVKVLEEKAKPEGKYFDLKTEVGNNLLEQIELDTKEARREGNKEALGLILDIYGYTQFEENFVVNDLEITGKWWDEVSLFGSYDELDSTYTRFKNVIEKYSGGFDFSTDNNLKRDLDLVLNLGLLEVSFDGEAAEALGSFYELQALLLSNKK